MSHGIYELCLCGHRYAEHSMFDVCHGCSDCENVEEGGGDHPYQQCECREFRVVEEHVVG